LKVLVFPHHLELGGSQVNAIDLAAATRDSYGHDIVVYATPGPAVELVQRRGLRFIAAPSPRMHPSPTIMRSLRHAVREEGVELVHAWDWPQCLDSFYGVHLGRGTPLVGSDMSMSVCRFLPGSIPLTYGTPELVAQAQRSRTGPVVLLEPPVDTERDHPEAVDASELLDPLGLEDGRLNLVIVSRLVGWMKLEGIERSIDAVALLARELPVRLIVVGGGSAYERLLTRAEAVNSEVGSRAVVITGPMSDPRPAYAAADVVLGMGGSVLRGMAFAKPCVVLGEEGFSEPFTEETAPRFLGSGFFGVGEDGSRPPLHQQLRQLLGDEALRRQLGAWSRRLVEERFSLGAGASVLDGLYRVAVAARPRKARLAFEAVRSLVYRPASAAIPDSIKRRLWRGGELRR
jgi:glycosyltransferase involved in cell wall biosynthesis